MRFRIYKNNKIWLGSYRFNRPKIITQEKNEYVEYDMAAASDCDFKLLL